MSGNELQIKPVSELPKASGRRGPRESKCLQIVEEAQNASTGIVSVEIPDAKEAELMKLYKSMIQWRKRHPDKKVGLRKDGPVLYVWVDKPKG